MSLVLDASAALAWIFERADPAEARTARALLRRISDEPTLVPELWHLEVANALVVGRRRDVVDASMVREFLTKLDALPIRTWETSNARRKEQLLAVAGQYELTAYDAVYLDLAIQTGASLATFDRRLMTARDRAGVPGP